MAIEILLRRSIDGLGQVGQTVRVKNGYARNYLIPRGLASLVTADAVGRIHKDKAEETVREAAEAKRRAELAERLSALTLTVEARSGEDGHLYGSVGAKHVLDALRREGYEIEARQIRFEAVRELGQYEVPLHLGREHMVNVKVWVVRDAREAADEAAEATRAAEAAAKAPPPANEPAAPARPA